MYRAAQWTAFGFGVVGKSLFFFCNHFLNIDCKLGSVLAIVAFRGVGAVGLNQPNVSDTSVSSVEKVTVTIDDRKHDTSGMTATA